MLTRFLFWTEWGQNPCIGRSRLDGSDQVTLVNSGIVWPNGISIDYEVTRLCCLPSISSFVAGILIFPTGTVWVCDTHFLNYLLGKYVILVRRSHG